MSSYVEVANRAAKAVGTAARLTAPDDDTVLGRAVADVWELERKAALRDAAWNFAVKRERLAKLKAAPKHGYDAQFQLPTDCLKLIDLAGNERLRYQLEGRMILIDAEGPLDIRYVADIKEPALFDATFVQAFALRIAVAIGPSIAGSAFDKGGTWQQYKDALGGAYGADAHENPPIEHEDSEWITSRFRYGSSHTLGGWEDGGA